MEYDLNCPKCSTTVLQALYYDLFDVEGQILTCPNCGLRSRITYDELFDSNSGEQDEWFELIAEEEIRTGL